jgi:hypothetical protein
MTGNENASLKRNPSWKRSDACLFVLAVPAATAGAARLSCASSVRSQVAYSMRELCREQFSFSHQSGMEFPQGGSSSRMNTLKDKNVGHKTGLKPHGNLHVEVERTLGECSSSTFSLDHFQSSLIWRCRGKNQERSDFFYSRSRHNVDLAS